MKKLKSKNPLIIFFSIMMTNLYQTANPLGPDKGSKSKNAKSSSQGKNNQKNPQFHYSFNGQIWIRDSHNSNRFFLSPIFNPCPPEIILNKVTDLPETKAWKQIFVNTILFVNLAMPELSGSWKPPANKNKETEYYIKLKVDWKNLNPNEKIDNAKVKKTKLTGNSDLPVPPWPSQFVSLTTLTTDIATADAKLLAHNQKLPNSTKPLATAVKLLYKDVKSIGTLVQVQMDAAPTNDESIRICIDAGYTYRAIVVRGKRENRVRQMTEPGWVQVEGEGKGGRDWQFSLNPFDNGEIKNLEYTTGGITTYNVGTSRIDAWFRWRRVLSKGKHGDWSDWFKGETP